MRQAIIMKRLAEIHGKQIRILAVEAAYSDAIVDAYNCTWKQRWGLPPVRGPPSFVLYKAESAQPILVDLQFQGPDGNNFRAHCSNMQAAWIPYNLLGKDLENGYSYKYQNEFKIKKITSNIVGALKN
jgi:hypothetical protein